MLFQHTPSEPSELRAAINAAYRMDESACVEHLLGQVSLSKDAVVRIHERAKELVTNVREERLSKTGIDAFLYEYDLSSEEGIALMCLAEALLRVPDKSNIDKLIRDKITSANWQEHIGQSDSFLVNAATWGLLLTGKVMSQDKAGKGMKSAFTKVLGRLGEPGVRGTVSYMMKLMSKQFVMGRTIQEAIKRAKTHEAKGYRYSYDMLGEAARTAEDAERYYQEYHDAIEAIGKAAQGKTTIEGPEISVKLSALHPRYEYSQRERVLNELAPRLLSLAQLAKKNDIGLTIDAEEADRLDLSLDVIEKVFSDPSLSGWEGFGLALQTYQKRAWYLIDWLAELSRKHKRRLNIRVIKGAYWDTEIKLTQELGLKNYPVFTRKPSTDVSFIANAIKILSMPDAFYPQFATHNAHTVATILELVGARKDFEFQCLHGMGQTLYEQIVGEKNLNIPCRVYAPVGSHEDLLPYLVRRLLENGANTSFVNRIVDAKVPIEDIIADPIAQVRQFDDKPHPKIRLPKDIFQPARDNSQSLDLSNLNRLLTLDQELETAKTKPWSTAPIINGHEHIENAKAVSSPSDHQVNVGDLLEATEDDVEQALQVAQAATASWDSIPVEQRAACLEKAAELFEKHRAEFMSLAIKEAGKTIPDALSEVREAIDFCRYYAAQARQQLAQPTILKGYTGEHNELQLHGRGVFVCISPWNFPLAIFAGQVTAALVAGNCVIAKPAEQTPLIAGLAIRLLHAAGIPGEVLQLLPGRGETIGAKLIADERIAGVIFTGSTETARLINQTLAQRQGSIIPFIAETGGQNSMLVDSSALPEQVVVDVIRSAFGSAGQRCSALRVLYLQEDIADKMLAMLTGAMAELTLGDPALLSTDIGPVIDKDAQQMLQDHADRMQQEAELIYQVKLPESCQQGTFFPPTAYEIQSIEQLPREVFGPILHVIRYKTKDLDKVIDEINGTGYGLTFGIHSRIDETIEYIQSRVHVGNCYVNRNTIGAIVGLQPFGGEGLSGTGPKAGGPHYLTRLCHERTVTVNTTAAGGNASLMSLGDE